MREIKFRAWDSLDKGFANGGYCRYINMQDNIVSLDSTISNSLIWCQYTGLKDKNGVEIYEGDIIKDQRGNLVSINVVKYREDKAKFTFNGWDIPSNVDKWCEVIGNVFENPELLDNA